MKLHKWSEFKKKFFTPAQIAQMKKEARAELLQMDLKALREFSGKTQTQLAKIAKISQAELSRAEAREDHRLSTLDRFVRALGGELEVVAHIGDTSIRLTSVRPQAQDTTKARRPARRRSSPSLAPASPSSSPRSSGGPTRRTSLRASGKAPKRP